MASILKFVARLQNYKLVKYVPAERVLTMDIIRGIAIFLMTIYHQGLVYTLDGTANDISYFFGYLAAPFFLVIAGGSLWYHEKHYQKPFKMIVHGVILFLFAWSVDVIAHQRFQIDWDIFQLIGIGYAVFGVLSFSGNDTRKYCALTFLICCWAFFPNFRPDQGVFAIWPYGAFFLAGYFFVNYVNSSFNKVYTTILFGLVMLAYLYYWVYVGILPHIISVKGITFAICLCLVLWLSGFVLEYKKTYKQFFFPWILRYGTYPLTLYYCQQTIALFCMKYQIYFSFFSSKTTSWMFQATLLLFVMLIITYIIDRYRFLSIEWWLRKVEIKVLAIGYWRNQY